jgi:polar amino acid transport system substrate-binding protein
MRFRIVSLTAVCLTILTAWASAAETLTLKADFWMPFNGDGKEESGYMLDIAKSIFEPKGYKIEFAMTPWDKSIAEVRNGKGNAIVAASQSDAPDFVYPAEEEGTSVQLFCVKNGSPWRYSGIASLKTIKLGVIKDYAYFQELDDYIKTSPAGLVFGTGDTPLQSNLTKLVQGEIGAVVDDKSVLKYTISKMNLQGKVAITAASGDAVKPAKLFIAFSPKNPKSQEYAKILSDGVIAMRKSGELQKILAKYGLTDWK